MLNEEYGSQNELQKHFCIPYSSFSIPYSFPLANLRSKQPLSRHAKFSAKTSSARTSLPLNA